jgi:hypothetical protein
MIKLLKYLAENLQKEDLYGLAMFLSNNPDVIDQETLLHIINDVNDFEMQTLPEELNERLNKIQEHFKEMDQHEELHKILKNNNIRLN